MVSEAQKESMKRWYYSHREQKIAKVKEWYSKNRERVAARNKAMYESKPKVMRQRATGWASRNKDKIKAYRHSDHYKEMSKKWINPKKTRARWLQYRYGITAAFYEDLLKSQNGVCAICGKNNDHPTRWGTRSRILVVDHCHRSKKTRGLLCHTCNAGLGYFQDSPELIEKALNYIRRFESL